MEQYFIKTHLVQTLSPWIVSFTLSACLLNTQAAVLVSGTHPSGEINPWNEILSNLYVSHPLPSTDEYQPEFFWTLSSSTILQLSYQILVSKLPHVPAAAFDNDEITSAAIIWNSGVIDSPNVRSAKYTGPSPLRRRTRYFWHIRVQTSVGLVTRSSLLTSGWGLLSYNQKTSQNTHDIDAIQDPLAHTFRQSSLWIWASEPHPPLAPAGDYAFRRTYIPPDNTSSVSAEIIMTVDDRFALFVDGVHIGGSPENNDEWGWRPARRFEVSLKANGPTLFAVRATNFLDIHTGGESPAGLLAAIKVTHEDGTTATIISDSSWKVKTFLPIDFEQPSIDDSAWATAQIYARYGVSPWNSEVTVPPATASTLSTIAITKSSSTSSSSTLNTLAHTFRQSSWIWSSEPNPPLAPAGDYAFRRTYIPPSNTSSLFAEIIITVDDRFDLFVDGSYIGGSFKNNNDEWGWRPAQRFNVSLIKARGPTTLFAVRGTNFPDTHTGGESPAGLIAAIQVTHEDGTTATILSDSDWKVESFVHANFENPDVDDSAWPTANIYARYGASPWNSEVSIPSTASTPRPTISTVPPTGWNSDTFVTLTPANQGARMTFINIGAIAIVGLVCLMVILNFFWKRFRKFKSPHYDHDQPSRPFALQPRLTNTRTLPILLKNDDVVRRLPYVKVDNGEKFELRL